MNILVCISSVPDTTTKIRFSKDNSTLETTDIQWIINPWDELALTRALELKDSGACELVSIVNVGNSATEPVIRKALAIGADAAIRINAEALDAISVANQIAAVIKVESYDLILTGIESSDYNGSSVGGMLAEIFNIPSISGVSSIDIQADEIICDREIEGGKEKVSVTGPVVAIVQKGIAKEPRIPSMRGIMQARTKLLNVIDGMDFSADTGFVGYKLPELKGACKMIKEENVAELFDLLHNEAKII